MRRAFCVCGWQPAKHAAGETRAACARGQGRRTDETLWLPRRRHDAARGACIKRLLLRWLRMRHVQAPKSTTVLGVSKKASPATQELDHSADRAHGLVAWPGQASLRIARPSFCTSQHSHCPPVPPRLRDLLLPPDWCRCGCERRTIARLTCTPSKRLALAAHLAVPCACEASMRQEPQRPVPLHA
jgi:hypothetical protein